MAWKVEISEGAKKSLKKLDMQISRRIIDFLKKRIAIDENPRRIGEGLEGSRLGEFWKYRIGDWRLVCRIEDKIITVLVLSVGHRREVYKPK